MPQNCPCFFDVCDNICRFFNEENDTCSYFKSSPPVPLSEILTVSERLNRLEIKPKKKTVSNSAGDNLNSKFIYLQNKLNAHLDKKKRSPIKKYD